VILACWTSKADNSLLCEHNWLALLYQYISQCVVWAWLTDIAIPVYVSACCVRVTDWHCYTGICLSVLCEHNWLALLYRYVSACCVIVTDWHCYTGICLSVLCERNWLALLYRYVSACCVIVTDWHCYTSICLNMLCEHNWLALLYQYMSLCCVNVTNWRCASCCRTVPGRVVEDPWGD